VKHYVTPGLGTLASSHRLAVPTRQPSPSVCGRVSDECHQRGLLSRLFENSVEGQQSWLGWPSGDRLPFEMANHSAEHRSLAGKRPLLVARMTGHITEPVGADVVKVTAPAIATKLSEEKLRELSGLDYM
jgi:hypothetical protein